MALTDIVLQYYMLLTALEQLRCSSLGFWLHYLHEPHRLSSFLTLTSRNDIKVIFLSSFPFDLETRKKVQILNPGFPPKGGGGQGASSKAVCQP